MRSQPASKALLAAIAMAAATCGVARADTTSTFSNFAPGVALNEAASFNLTGLGGTGPVTVDPNNPDVLYAINRAAPPGGGVYPFSLSTHARLTNSSGDIFIGSASPMTWTSATDPYTAVVGNDGSLYVGMYVSAGIYKIENPLSDSPTVTRLLGSYTNGGGDDDMVNVARMPANFGLANYSANDLIVFDDGNNADGVNTVFALHTDGSDGNAPTIVWQRPSASTAAGTIHGAVDPNSGYAYWINNTPEHNSLDGTDYATLFRVKGDGVLQTIGISLPAGVTLANADDPIAINPVDGSLWLADSIFSSGTDTQARTMLRIDTAHLAATSDPNAFVATATAMFSAANFNMGVNGLTFSNDGTTLYAGTPNGTDKLWAFDVTPDVAPPHFPGDTNNDGVVDLVDLNNVLNNFGASGTNPGDDNTDGVVDLVDLNNVLNNFGATHAAGALSVVPEPASLGLIGLGAAALLRRRRHAR